MVKNGKYGNQKNDFRVPQNDFRVPQNDFRVPQNDFRVPKPSKKKCRNPAPLLRFSGFKKNQNFVVIDNQ